MGPAEGSAQAGTFRLNSRYVFLTYAKCSTPKAEMRTFLEGLGAESGLVAQEAHEDGEPHLHCVIDWGRKKNVRDARAFDYDGVHPNVQSPKKISSVVKYCSKEDDEPEVWGTTFDQESLVKELLLCKTKHAAQMFLLDRVGMHPRFNTWIDIWASRPKVVNVIEIPPKPWWALVPKGDQLMSEGGRPKGLWLKGPPECGKTRYVENTYKDRAVFYLAGPKGFMGYNGEDVIVIDDMCAATWQNHNDFIKRMVTEPCCTTPPYYGTHDLAWPRLVIVTCNNLSPTAFTDRALEERFVVFDVAETLNGASENE